MSELSRRGARLLEHPALAAPPVAEVAARARRYRSRRRWRAAVAACVAVAVVAAGAAWRPAAPVPPAPAPAPAPQAESGALRALPAPAIAPVPAGPARAHGAPGTWVLASYLAEPAGWSRNDTGGPAAGGYLSCPQVGTCYYAGAPGGGSSSGPGPAMDTLYVSHDGGLSWTAIRLSGGVTFTTALACPAAGDCLAGGEVSGRPVLLATGDGGDRWSYRALPPGDGVISELTCPAVGSCDALAVRPGKTWFLTTSDAGARWSRLSFPAGDTIAALSCFTAADCVAVGTTDGRADSAGLPPGVALRTADAGRTWTAGVLPSGTSFPSGAFPSVACAGPATCYALGLSPQPSPSCVTVAPGSGLTRHIRVRAGAARHRPRRPASPPPCQPTYSLQPASVAAVSTDGGATWRLLAMPPGTPQPDLFGLSCPTAQDCWIAGEQAVAQNVPGGGSNGGSAMILATGDGGASWTKTTFAATRLASGQQADSLMAVAEISCAAVNSCVGIGAADQGSYHTPVYTNAGG